MNRKLDVSNRSLQHKRTQSSMTLRPGNMWAWPGDRSAVLASDFGFDSQSWTSFLGCADCSCCSKWSSLSQDVSVKTKLLNNVHRWPIKKRRVAEYSLRGGGCGWGGAAPSCWRRRQGGGGVWRTAWPSLRTADFAALLRLRSTAAATSSRRLRGAGSAIPAWSIRFDLQTATERRGGRGAARRSVRTRSSLETSTIEWHSA